MDRDKAYRLIQYAQATTKLSEKSDTLPTRESHVRELLKLETDDQRAEVWQRVVRSVGRCYTTPLIAGLCGVVFSRREIF